MSDTTKDLVDAIAKGDAMGTENAFQAALQSKIADKLDVMRQDVAKNIFATPEQEVALEDAEEESVEFADSEGGEIN